ncbi:VOC family protein [Arenimonas terrae]|uniref:VOC family protein n=1 Tax=Arenimonas terrae TaxID=2546226 RepID=A0A5C4RWR4_9GAMM|nr:VOC family protein [Arenimonas terrae]TNJ35703.1 VOC family protein [Arenimonas terrae]
MDLGNFSVSLAVKDIHASRAFYEALGFTAFHDQSQHGWMILKNGDAVVGLFQGMFEKNMLCFNPGWDNNGQNVDPYTDVREIQRQLKAKGITPVKEFDESTNGRGHLIVVDPDGNPVLVDQHR